VTRRPFINALAFAAVIAATSAAAPATALAQKVDSPAIVLTVKSAGELIADFRYLVSSIGKGDDPQVAQILAVLDSLKDPATLQGLDPSKPLGAFGSLPEGNEPPSAVIFVPVLNAQTLLDAMNQNGLTVEPDNTSPGFTHKLTLPNAPIPLFVTSGGGYLYFSLAPTGADVLKAMNPATLLPKRPGAGDLSLTVRIDRLGPQFQQGFNTGLENAIAAQRERQPNEGDDAFKARLAFIKMYQDAFIALVRDGKELALDLAIDPKTETLGVELTSSAVSGTPYAAALRTFSGLKSKFSGMTANAAMAGAVSVPLGKGLRDLIGQTIDQGKEKALADPKAADPAARKIVEQIADTLRATLTAESIDAALTIQPPATSTGKYTAVMAMAMKGGKVLDSALRDAIKSAPAEDRKNFTADIGKTTNGTPIHKIVNTQPAANPTAAAAFGENIVFAAFGDTVAAFAVGTDGQSAINRAFEPAANGGKAPQIEAYMAASRMAAFADTPAERDAMQAAAADVFAGKGARKDRISMTIRGEGESMTLRIGSDVPALKFLARFAELQGKVNQ